MNPRFPVPAVSRSWPIKVIGFITMASTGCSGPKPPQIQPPAPIISSQPEQFDSPDEIETRVINTAYKPRAPNDNDIAHMNEDEVQAAIYDVEFLKANARLDSQWEGEKRLIRLEDQLWARWKELGHTGLPNRHKMIVWMVEDNPDPVPPTEDEIQHMTEGQVEQALQDVLRLKDKANFLRAYNKAADLRRLEILLVKRLDQIREAP